MLIEFKKEFYLVDESDIEAHFLSGLFTENGEEKSILHRADTSKTQNELIKWISIRLRGHIINMIEKQSLFTKEVISEDISDDEDMDDSSSENSLFDFHAKNEWLDSTDDNFISPYAGFLDKIGGLKNILSPQQLKVFHMNRVQNITQDKIAKELNISQQSVSKTLKRAHNKLKSEYLTFRTYEFLAKDNTNTYKKITEFLGDFENIRNFDSGSFDYFNYLIDWIKKGYLSESTTVTFKDFESIQKNTYEITTTPFDIIVDGARQNEQQLFRDVLNTYVVNSSNEITFTKREKERFVKSVIRILNDYDKSIKKNVKEMNKTFVDKMELNNDNFKAIADIFKSVI